MLFALAVDTDDWGMFLKAYFLSRSGVGLGRRLSPQAHSRRALLGRHKAVLYTVSCALHPLTQPLRLLSSTVEAQVDRGKTNCYIAQ